MWILWPTNGSFLPQSQTQPFFCHYRLNSASEDIVLSIDCACEIKGIMYIIRFEIFLVPVWREKGVASKCYLKTVFLKFECTMNIINSTFQIFCDNRVLKARILWDLAVELTKRDALTLAPIIEKATRKKISEEERILKWAREILYFLE